MNKFTVIEPLKLTAHPMDIDPNDDVHKLGMKLNEVIDYIKNPSNMYSLMPFEEKLDKERRDEINKLLKQFQSWMIYSVNGHLTKPR